MKLAAVRRSARLQRRSQESTSSTNSETLDSSLGSRSNLRRLQNNANSEGRSRAAKRQTRRRTAQLRPTSAAWTDKKRKQNRITKPSLDAEKVARCVCAAKALTYWTNQSSEGKDEPVVISPSELARESIAEEEATAESNIESERNQDCIYCPDEGLPSRCAHKRTSLQAQSDTPSKFTKFVMPSIEYYDPDAKPSTAELDCSENDLESQRPWKIQKTQATQDGVAGGTVRANHDARDTRDSGYYSAKPGKERQVPRALRDAFLARDAHTRLLMHGYDKEPEDAHVGYNGYDGYDGYNGYNWYTEYTDYEGDDESMIDCFSDTAQTLVGSPEYIWDKEDGYFDKAARQAQHARDTYGGPSWLNSPGLDQYTEIDFAFRPGSRAPTPPWTSKNDRYPDVWAQYYNPAPRNGNSNRDRSKQDQAPTRPTALDPHLCYEGCASKESLAEPSEYHDMNMMYDNTSLYRGPKGKEIEAAAPMPQTKEPDEMRRAGAGAGTKQDPPEFFVSRFIPRSYIM